MKESDFYFVKYVSTMMKEEPILYNEMLLNQYSRFFNYGESMPCVLACFYFLNGSDEVVAHRESVNIYDISFNAFRCLPSEICKKMHYQEFICPAQGNEASDLISKIERIYWSQFSK